MGKFIAGSLATIVSGLFLYFGGTLLFPVVAEFLVEVFHSTVRTSRENPFWAGLSFVGLGLILAGFAAKIFYELARGKKERTERRNTKHKPEMV